MRVFVSSSWADRRFAERLHGGILALGHEVLTHEKLGDTWDQTLREALEASDAVVLVVPEPGARKANTAFFEAGAARALGKPVVAVLPISDASRAAELPSDMYGFAVFDGSKVAPESLASSIVTALSESLVEGDSAKQPNRSAPSWPGLSRPSTRLNLRKGKGLPPSFRDA